MGIFKKNSTPKTTTSTIKVNATVTTQTTNVVPEQSQTRTLPKLGLEPSVKKDGEKRVYNLIVLDESGSMGSIYRQALTGANETINTIRIAQRDIPDVRQYLTFVTFDSGSRRSSVRAIINNKPIDQVKDLTEDDYQPGGCTPLYDAMGISITELKELVQDGDNVLVTVITDGFENSSEYFSASMVKELVESLRARGWVFTYIGANQDSVEVAGGLGIRNSMDFSQDAVGSAMMFKKMNSSRKAYYSKVMRNMDRDHIAEDLEEDFFSDRKSLDRVSHEQISHLQPDEVLVFGSNITGSHSGGLAAYAVNHFGAVVGVAEGPQGQCYAIPTTGVTYEQIGESVERFISYAENHPQQKFIVTRIGCGNAGYRPSKIAPLFAGALSVENIFLPEDFWNVIKYRFVR